MLKYLDLVTIKDGFYQGSIGYVSEESEDGKYKVDILTKEGESITMTRTGWISEDKLELAGSHNPDNYCNK